MALKGLKLKKNIILMSIVTLLALTSFAAPAQAIIIIPDKPIYNLTLEVTQMQIHTIGSEKVQVDCTLTLNSLSDGINPATEHVWVYLELYPEDPGTIPSQNDPMFWPTEPDIMPIAGFDIINDGWAISSGEMQRTNIETLEIIKTSAPNKFSLKLIDTKPAITTEDYSQVILYLSIGNDKGNQLLLLKEQKGKYKLAGPGEQPGPPIPPNWYNLRPHELIFLIQTEVDELASQKVLNQGQHNALSIELDSSWRNVMGADPLGVLQHLEQFESKTSAFVRGNIFTRAQGQPLLAAANLAAEKVHSSALIREVFEFPANPCIPDDIEGTPIFVALKFPPKFGVAGGPIFEPVPDGTAERPYPTIHEALAAAEALELEAVDILVSRGTYPGDLELMRHTGILGEAGVVIQGSIINNGPYELRLENVTITSSDDTLAGEQGAVLVNHQCARTILRNVDIEDAEGYGIYQRGGTLDVRAATIQRTQAELGGLFGGFTGTGIYLKDGVVAYLIEVTVSHSERYGLRQKGGILTLHDSEIMDTEAQSETSASGTGIWLSDGVESEFRSVFVYRSGSSALILEDSGTTVDAAALFIRDTEVNPYLWDEFGTSFAAVDVLNGAELEMGWSLIEDSELVGLRARGEDSQINFHDGSISGTIEFPIIIDGGEGIVGGINVIVMDDGYIELTAFRSYNAEFIALVLLEDGALDAHDGLVDNNPIGANVQIEGYDINRLRDDVIYVDNGMNLYLDEAPVPDAVTDLGDL